MSKTQILIVEDEVIVAKDLQGMLRRMGYDVPVTVGTGALAIEAAAKNQPHLILMDIQLRGEMDGVQTASAIAAQQDVPIVYLTANSDEATLQRAKKTDPFGFLIKPFEERSIQAGIEMALYKHQSEKRNREREQWLSTTLTSIADAVITTDAVGKITFLNAAAEKLSGWPQADALGCRYEDVFRILDETSQSPPVDSIARALADGTSGNLVNHTLLVRRDSTRLHIEHSVAPIRQGIAEKIGGCVIVFSDVSERKLLEDQLRHAQKMDAIGKLAGGIAHDFNNAITAIVGYAEMILLRLREPDILSKNAKQIVRAAEHSSRLTHQLLAFSRKQMLQPRCLDLREELRGIEGMVRRLIGENIVLTIRAAQHPWKILADAGQIQQVLLNMAINARDAMPRGGELAFELANVSLTSTEALRIPDGYAGEFLLLTISDNGEGMSAEVQQRIFEPFFTTKEPGKGTGLGLATCYGILKQSSGLVSVSSQVGVGTKFSIYLPKAEVSEPAVAQEFGGDELPRGNETVLVVEDEEILRELSILILEGLGYKVLTASDGADAVQVLSGDLAQSIDLVVTDLAMPRMSGRELVDWIKLNFGPMRVLFMSGYTSDEIVRSAIEGAEVEFLQKPFTPKTLARKIREILDRSNAPDLRRVAAA